jgi:hypothetical protein
MMSLIRFVKPHLRPSLEISRPPKSRNKVSFYNKFTVQIDGLTLNLQQVGLNVQTISPLVKALLKHPLVVTSINFSQNSFFKDPSLILFLNALPNL